MYNFFRRLFNRRQAQAQRRAYRAETIRKYEQACKAGDTAKANLMRVYLRTGH